MQLASPISSTTRSRVTPPRPSTMATSPKFNVRLMKDTPSQAIQTAEPAITASQR